RVEIIVTVGATSKRAATGAGFWSITRVTAFTLRVSPGGRLSRNVTGTMAASSARAGISMAMSPVPSAIGRPSNASRTRSGQGSVGSGAAAKAHALHARSNPTAAKRMVLAGIVLPPGRRIVLPFELGESGGGVAGIILLEQLPCLLFRRGRCRGGGADHGAAGDVAAHIRGEALQIAPLRR